jgi:hypothetical protein
MSTNYRLAAQCPFSKGFQDAHGALKWVVKKDNATPLENADLRKRFHGWRRMPAGGNF